MAMSLTARPCISATRPARVGAKNVKPARIAPVTKATAAGEVPDMDKRNTMNLLLLGGISLPVGAMGLPYLAFFVPNTGGAGSVGIVGKDKLGNDVKVSQWTKTHGPNDRSLIQGLKGDPSYLIVKEDQTVENYALNAVCTHLGCVVPWQSAENKFKCPCHGSQYNAQGKVVRGPAPLSLALQHVDTQDDTVIISPWSETDFRDGSAPWWA